MRLSSHPAVTIKRNNPEILGMQFALDYDLEHVNIIQKDSIYSKIKYLKEATGYLTRSMMKERARVLFLMVSGRALIQGGTFIRGRLYVLCQVGKIFILATHGEVAVIYQKVEIFTYTAAMQMSPAFPCVVWGVSVMHTRASAV